MKKILFKYAGCNGWALYDKKYIDKVDPKNSHVAEVTITIQDGKETVVLNPGRETICGCKLKPERQYSFATKDASKMREKLAFCQNNGEVCGVCVSHFYADAEA